MIILRFRLIEIGKFSCFGVKYNLIGESKCSLVLVSNLSATLADESVIDFWRELMYNDHHSLCTPNGRVIRGHDYHCFLPAILHATQHYYY